MDNTKHNDLTSLNCVSKLTYIGTAPAVPSYTY